MLEKSASPGAKSHALGKSEARLRLVAEWLSSPEFLLDEFSVADAYLFTVLNWSQVTPIDLKLWPSIVEYQARLVRRPSIARAVAEEQELYVRELARHGERIPRAVVPSTATVIEKFNAAFLRHNPAALGELLAEACVLENTQPAPDGSRHIGRDASGSEPGRSVRGVNLMRVRDGLIVEASGYVKGA